MLNVRLIPGDTVPSTPSSAPVGIFATTRWTVVLNAGHGGSLEAEAALESLCRTYWYPVYAFIRSRGRSPEDAQDLTQEFFARLLAKHWVENASPEKGRFRTFLRMALKRFLANEWDRARAQKRGGGAMHVPFDVALAEERFVPEQAGMLAPDKAYDRRWALTLLSEAMKRLEAEYENAGKAGLWRQLQPYLTAERGSIAYPEVAGALGIAEGAARVAVHRLRKRFREVFRETIADTVDSPEEVEPETRLVLEILSDG